MKNRVIKGFLSALIALATVFGTVVFSPSVSAEKGDGLSYTFRNGQATVSGYSGGDSSVVEIPSEIDGFPVTCIGESAFSFTSVTGVTIPDSVKKIDRFAFSNCESLTDLTIGSGVESIEEYAFSDCTALAEVTIPGSVKKIDEFSFYNCTSLVEVTIPDSVTDLESYAFHMCDSIERVVIGGGVKYLNGSVFSDCDSLASVTLSQGVKKIGGFAFAGLKALAEVTIPDSVEYIEDYAFEDCESLTRVTIPGSVKVVGWGAFDGCASLTDLTIENGVERIEGFAFSYCTALTDVTIPDSVKYVGEVAFCDCSSLTDVTVGRGNKDIESDAFEGCRSLETVKIDTQTVPMAFNGSETLRTVILGDNVRSIGEGAFYGCTALSDVIISDSVKYIDVSSFFGCVSLTSIRIPDSVIAIFGCAFSQCSSLRTVYLGKGIGFIEMYAFDGCFSLQNVYYAGSEEDWYGSVEKEDPNECLFGAKIVFGCFEHVPVWVEAKDPTCTENGNIGFWMCSECKTIFAEEECETEIREDEVIIPALGHVSDDWVETVTPTCTAKGEKTGLCTRCNTVAVVGIEPIGHDFGKYGDDKTCSRCGAINPMYYSFSFFKDVYLGDYYDDAVTWALVNGITAGTGMRTFSPEAECRRGQVVTFLWRAAGSPEPASVNNPFYDVTSKDYCYKAVLWAVENGITTGTSRTTFSPDEVCTRGQIVTFQWRANKCPEPSSANNPFGDVEAGDYYYDAVLWAVGEKITNGTDASHFSPSDTCTRGQVVTFLFRDMA